MAASRSGRASESQRTAPLSKLEAEALIVARGVRSSCDTEDSSADLSRSLSSRTLARVSQVAARLRRTVGGGPPRRLPFPHLLTIVQSLDADLDAIGEEFLEGQPSDDLRHFLLSMQTGQGRAELEN